MEKPAYYAMLTAEVRYDKNLKPMEKLLYAEITAMLNMNGYCHAGNKYFAELYGVSLETVSRWISNLVKHGYIETFFEYKNGTNQIEKRVIVPLDKKIKGYCQKDQGGIDKKVKDINTLTESINNSTREKEEFSFSLPKRTQYKNLSFEYREKLEEYAREKRPDLFEDFLDFHISKGNKFVDWSRAFNTWVRNEKKYSRKQQVPAKDEVWM